jgi:hypothetical protein
MFACIQGRGVSKLPVQNDSDSSSLVDLAFTFSPLVEQTTADTVVFDIAGQELLFGEAGTSETDVSLTRWLQQRIWRMKLFVAHRN